MEQNNVGVEVKMEKDSSFAFKGVLEIFYDPTSFFTKLKEDPKIFVPYVVLFLVSLLTGYLLSDLIMQVQLESPELQEQLNGGELPESVMAFMEVMSIAGLAISMCLIPLITAALASFFGNFVMGGKASYKSLLSLMVYAETMYIIGSMVVIPMALAKGSLMTGFSLGFLAADQGIQSFAFVALSKISLFHIWEVIVAGIGLSIFYDFSRNKGYTLAVLSIGLLSIMHIGAAAIGALFK